MHWWANDIMKQKWNCLISFALCDKFYNASPTEHTRYSNNAWINISVWYKPFSRINGVVQEEACTGGSGLEYTKFTTCVWMTCKGNIIYLYVVRKAVEFSQIYCEKRISQMFNVIHQLFDPVVVFSCELITHPSWYENERSSMDILI